MGMFDVRQTEWSAPGSNTYANGTLPAHRRERNLLVTYIRTRTRYGTYLSPAYRTNVEITLAELSRNDRFMQNSLRPVDLFLYDMAEPCGHLIPRGLPYISYNSSDNTCGLQGKESGGGGADVRLVPHGAADLPGGDGSQLLPAVLSGL